MQDNCCRHLRRSSMLLFFIIAHFDFYPVLAAPKFTDVVNTTTGPVQGIILNTVNSVPYAAFKGIPFAEPPLGFNRFKPPIPIEPWTTTLNATADGPRCMQTVVLFGSETIGSEDCLIINVYTTTTNLSETPTKLKPVMFWIYGGAYSRGTSSSNEYRPDYMLEKEVVYVAFNYRLGPFGFLSLDHKNATGNAGLKDQLLALKWTKDNIEKFGGNPNNITIFGQSAGSASVGLHILSDASAGLFQGAISMSGVPLNPWAFHTPLKALSRGVLLGSLLGTISVDKEKLLETFYSATAEDLAIAGSKMTWAILPFAPTIENEDIATDPFLTKCTVDKYRSGNFTKVPQMMGFTDNETVTFAVALQPIIGLVDEATELLDTLSLALPSNLALLKTLIDTKRDALQKLLHGSLDVLIEETTDLLFIAQIDQTQKYFAERNDGIPIYYYHTSFYTKTSLHNIKTNSTLEGSGHLDDLAYLFYHPELNFSEDPLDPARQTVERVSTMWTNFAKHGNPTPDWVPEASVGITWPDSGIMGRCLNIGRELSVEPRPTNANTKLLEAISSVKLRLANGCISPL